MEKVKTFQLKELVLTLAIICTASICFGQKLRSPMSVNMENSSMNRWLQKPVLESRLLDDMENPDNWKIGRFGKMEQTSERKIDGSKSIRLYAPVRTKTVSERFNGEGAFGEAGIMRTFDKEDWSKYNRISFWVYPDAKGSGTIQILTKLLNNGNLLNERTKHLAMNFTELKNREWNQVVWEFGDHDRNAVTGLSLAFEMRGKPFYNGPDTLIFDFDHIELQRVEADYVEGWEVAPGKISFSHTGYMPDGQKEAFASGLQAQTF